MKKEVMLFVCAALAPLMLTACKEAPEEVKTNNSILDNNSAADKETVQLEFASMDEIRANFESENESNSTNVTVGKVRVGDGDSMPSYTIKKHYDGYKNIEDLVEYVYGVDMSEQPENVEEFPHTEWYPGTKCEGGLGYLTVAGDNTSPSLITQDCGSLGVEYDYSEYLGMEAYELVKTYQIYMGDDPDDDSYVMSDNVELKVSDAIDGIEELYNEHISPIYENEFNCKVKELFVYEYDDGTYGYAYDMEYKNPDGNYFATCLMCCLDIDEFAAGNSIWISENDWHGYVIDSEMHVYAYAEDTAMKDEVVDSGEEILTYKSALEQISSTLASSKVYDFDVATLEYLISYDKCDDYINIYNDGTLIDYGVGEHTHDESTTTTAVPYWVFQDFDLNTTFEAFGGGCVVVNALNGKVTVL